MAGQAQVSVVPHDEGQEMPGTRTVCGREEEQEHPASTAGCLGRLSRGGKEQFGGQVMTGIWLERSEGALGWVGGHPVGVGRGKALRWKRFWSR